MIFIDFDNRNGGGSGGGVTSGEVQTMIDASISGKADTSAVTDVSEEVETKQTLYTATTLSDITNPKEGDVASITTTASSTTWVSLTLSEYEDILDNMSWGNNNIFKFEISADGTGDDTWKRVVVTSNPGESDIYAWGIGFDYDSSQSEPVFVYYNVSDLTLGNALVVGEEQIIEFPTDTTYVEVLKEGTVTQQQEELLSIWQQQDVVSTSLTQYSYVNGEWVETGTGSGGEQFVELTLAEYTALTSYTENTTYIITDAPSIDLNTLATTGQVATKADKASVTANSSRLFPTWNSQGIITGTTGNTVYLQSLNINGTSKTMLQSTNSSFGNIYAPTSAGTAGQVLQSNGSGAPVWSTFKMWYGNQTQYDAITTKDNNTIYFVKDDD